MKRGIIRMTEGGQVTMPQKDVWMTIEEITDMFGLPEAIVYRTIRSIYKKSEFYMSMRQQKESHSLVMRQMTGRLRCIIWT